MATPNKETCILLLEREVANYEAGLYILNVRARAAVVVENKESEEALRKEAEGHIKLIDFLNKEIEKVKNG